MSERSQHEIDELPLATFSGSLPFGILQDELDEKEQKCATAYAKRLGASDQWQVTAERPGEEDPGSKRPRSEDESSSSRARRHVGYLRRRSYGGYVPQHMDIIWMMGSSLAHGVRQLRGGSPRVAFLLFFALEPTVSLPGGPMTITEWGLRLWVETLRGQKRAYPCPTCHRSYTRESNRRRHLSAGCSPPAREVTIHV